MHQAKLIRQRVAQLLAGATDAENRVFPTREAPLREGELPALAVYMLDDTADPESRWTAPRVLKRTSQLAIVAVVMLNEGMDDALDDLREQVERAMHRDPTLGGTATDSVYASTQLARDEKGSRPVGMARVVYNVFFLTDAPTDVDVPLDDLDTVDVRTNLGGALPVGNEAEDTVEVGP